MAGPAQRTLTSYKCVAKELVTELSSLWARRTISDLFVLNMACVSVDTSSGREGRKGLATPLSPMWH